MIKRIYQMEDLTESSEMLRQGPHWWIHATLFGLILVLLAAVSVISAVIRSRLKNQARSAASQVSFNLDGYRLQRPITRSESSYE